MAKFLLLITLFFSAAGFAAKQDSLQIQKLLESAKDKLYTEPAVAVQFSHEALEQARQFGYPFFEAKASLYLGILAHIQSEYPEGIIHLNHAYILADQFHYSTIKGSALLNLGNIYYGMQDALTALEYFYQAAAQFEENKEVQQLGSSYNNIALVLKATGENDKALNYFQKSLVLARQTKNEIGIENARGNIAGVYLENGNLDQALTILLEQNINYHRTENIYRLAQNRYNLARVYAKQDKWQTAIDTMQAAYKSYQSFKNIQGMLGSGLELGNWQLVRGNISAAVDWVQELERLSRAHEDSFLDEVLLFHAAIEKKRHNYKAATAILEELMQLNDTNMTHRFQQMVKIRQANFEVEKKQLLLEKQLQEQELQLEMADAQQTWLYSVSALSSFLLICLIITVVAVVKMRSYSKHLRVKNKFIRDQLKQLEDLNQSKNRMFSIIAHDLKSPLASMQPALRLISEDEVEKEEKEFLLNSLLQVVEISDFNMENILHWAQHQMDAPETAVTTFSLNQTLEKILPMYRLLLQFKQVQLEADIENDLMIRADQDQISFVIRNLIHNAIKFTYPGGKIEVKAHYTDGVVIFAVTDYGQGMSEKQVKELLQHKRLRSTAGTSLETGTGLGLRLTVEYISQNGAQYCIDSTAGEGTEFKIFFNGEKLNPN